MQLTSALGTGIGIKTQLDGSYGHGNVAGTAASLYDNRWQSLQRTKQLYRYAPATKRRSYSEGGGGGLAAVLNGLSNLSGLGHISNGYGTVAPTHTEALAVASTKQEIPIYEEQREDASIAALAANDYGVHGSYGVAGGSGSGSGGDENNQQHSSAGLHAAIYNFPATAAAAHNGGFLPSYGGADHSAWTPSTAQHSDVGQPHAYDKISVGNFLHHYEHNSGYGEQQQQHQHQQQQQEQQQQHEAEHASIYASQLHAVAEASDYQQHDESEEQHSSNYLSESGGHGAQQQSHHHTDIINYLPYPVVKKQHVPVEKPVQIPVSHAVIVPVRKPVPIHIPITKQVQVAVEKELKIPVERVVPYPVEKHVPVPVEKRVPYTVVKYVPIKIPKPFPVKVPVFKTVLHKVKGWW